MLSEQEKVYTGKLKVTQNITTADKIHEVFKSVGDEYRYTFYIYDGNPHPELNDNQILIVVLYDKNLITCVRRRNGWNIVGGINVYYDTTCNIGDVYKIVGIA